MKPVALMQHDRTQRPGFLLDFLNEQGIPSVTFAPEEGDDVPRSAHDFSGIILLGSPRSVNDPLPWIQQELALVRAAMAADVAVLGHCFGGQLIAKSLGATVCRNAWSNIGWSRLRVTPPGQALFGASQVVAFNWHHETFGIPRGAQRTLFGEHCLNKGFVFGKHMAFQCHFEVTDDIIREWCSTSQAELSSACGPAAQKYDDIIAGLEPNLPGLHRVARQVYRSWINGLTRPPVAHLHGGW